MSDNFNYVSPLKEWCHKILPLVYDDSLSYYEVLCKVTRKLNEVIKDIDKLPQYIAELLDEETLKDILSTVLNQLRENIAIANEGQSKTATAPRTVGELVWLDGELYRIIHNMIAGDQYVVGSNCEKVTIEGLINGITNEIDSKFELLEEDIIDKYNILDGKIDGIDDKITDINTLITNVNIASVKEYGAIGDGITDDYDSIIACISENDNIYFPKGEYLINSRLIVGGSKNLYGVNGSIIKCGFNDSSILKLTGENCLVKGISFKGNSNTSEDGTEFNHGIYLGDPRNINIIECSFEDLFGDGIYMGNDNFDTIVPTNTTIDKCYFNRCGRNGISVISNDSFKITNCYIANTGGHNPQVAIDLEPNQDGAHLCGIIDNIHSYNNANGFLQMYVNITLENDANIIVSNIISDNDGLAGRPIFALDEHHESHGNTGIVTFENINVTRGRSTGLSLYGMSSRFKFNANNLVFDHHFGENIFDFYTRGVADIQGYFNIDFDVINRYSTCKRIVNVIYGGQDLHKVFLNYHASANWYPGENVIGANDEIYISSKCIYQTCALRVNDTGSVVNSTMDGWTVERTGVGRYTITPPIDLTNGVLIGTACCETPGYVAAVSHSQTPASLTVQLRNGSSAVDGWFTVTLTIFLPSGRYDFKKYISESYTRL